jgi:hypothetical protein
MAKLLVASVAGALVMSLLAYGGSGQLGNFGHVGVDQRTFLVGVFFWFVVVGWITIVMAGGLTPIRLRRPGRPKPAAPAADEPADFAGLFDEPDAEAEHDSAEEDLPGGDDYAPPPEKPERQPD